MRKNQLHKIKWTISGIILTAISLITKADSYNIHVSENAITKTKIAKKAPKTNSPLKNQHFHFSELTELSESSKVSYVANNHKALNPKESNNDAKLLGNSIEFELYQTSENHMSHTIFESGAGVCNGFKSNNGVEITDSRTYYIDKPNNEYYASIIGATAYSEMDIDNMQYAPIFNIRDPMLAKNIQEQEREAGKQLAEKNIQKSTKFLKTLICK